MATKKKLLQAAAGQAGGGGLNVEEVFSTYLYAGTGSAQTITNGIDLDGEGGLVWIKNRNNVYDHVLDHQAGDNYYLKSNSSGAQQFGSGGITSFNTDGFSIGSLLQVNDSSSGWDQFVSWTFRKAPKFFDVVTYTGTDASLEVQHNLGATPGCVIIKRTDSTSNWNTYIRDGDDGSGGFTYSLFYTDTGLNSSAAADVTGLSGAVQAAITDTFVNVNTLSGGTNNDNDTNVNGGSYVMYLFAHNDGDGEFGPDGDADIIKCGSYTGNGGVNSIDLGWEPQWLLIKAASTTQDWVLYDNMRGVTDSASDVLFANSSQAGVYATSHPTRLDPTGFTHMDGRFAVNGSGVTYIYIAIRRGPMAVPESATDVFDVQTYTGNATLNRKIDTGFSVDANLTQGRFGVPACLGSRLIDGMFQTNSTAVTYGSLTDWIDWDYNDGYELANAYTYSNQSPDPYVSYSWKRAPSFFDVVAYTGNNTAGNTISHNLGVAPEMMWIKSRSNAVSWIVYHKDLNGGTNPEDYYMILNSTNAEANDSTGDFFNSTAPTATNFTLGSSYWVNGTSNIAYLFASLDGVSKVGSYTGNGTSATSTNTIDCGFSSGARFVLCKRTDSAGNWVVFDTERGIVAGADSYMYLNLTNAEVTTVDVIDPNSSGFTLVGNYADWNANGGTYIFYAIA